MTAVLPWFVLVLKNRDPCIIVLSCHCGHPAAAALAVIHEGNIGIPSQATPLVISSVARDLVSRFLPPVEMTEPYLHVPWEEHERRRHISAGQPKWMYFTFTRRAKAMDGPSHNSAGQPNWTHFTCAQRARDKEVPSQSL
jgi:hypothetical protein